MSRWPCAKLSTDLMERLFAAPLVWHEAHHGVETGHRVQQSTRALYDFAQSQFIYLQSATSLIGPVVALWIISTWIGFAATCGYVVLGLIIVNFDRLMMRLATSRMRPTAATGPASRTRSSTSCRSSRSRCAPAC